MSKSDYVKPTFCPAPWVSIEIGARGQLRPCCVYYGAFGNIARTDLEEAFNGAAVENLRNKLRRDEWPAECWHCSNGEYMGSTSRRTEYIDYLRRYNVDFNYEPGLISFVVRFSSLCNLACRHCKSGNSSKWTKYETLLAQAGFDVEQAPPFTISEERFKKMEEFLLAHRDTLRSITVKGGEPVIEPQFKRFLRFLVESGMASQIDMDFFTNGTMPSAEILASLKEFNSCCALISLEGTGRMYQYIRSDQLTLESEVLSAAQAYKTLPRATVVWRPTFCAYNIWDVENLYQFCCVKHPFDTVDLEKFEHRVLGHFIQQRVDYPRYLTPSVFSEDYRRKYLAWLDRADVEERGKEFVRKYFEIYPYDVKMHEKFIQFTSLMDDAQAKALVAVEPRFAEVMKL